MWLGGCELVGRRACVCDCGLVCVCVCVCVYIAGWVEVWVGCVCGVGW